MDFHIDKKMGLLLLGTFVLGGLIGGLAGVAVGYEGRDYRDGRGRSTYSMMGGSRFGTRYDREEGSGMQRILMRRNVPQNTTVTEARNEVVPVVNAVTAPAPLEPVAPVQ